MAPRSAMLAVAAQMVFAFALVAASPVPGDQYPTVGLTLGGYSYTVNVTTYANASADVRDIVEAVRSGDFASAKAIYDTGKNSFRNQLPGSVAYRIPKGAISRNYTTEEWYVLAATRYYPELKNRYLDGIISDALNATGDYAPGGTLASVRADVVAAAMLFYPVLYYYHEADAAWNTLKKNDTNTAPALAEVDDAVGCILAPNVLDGRSNQRMAPGFNPWDVSEKVATCLCTTTVQGGRRTSKANARFLESVKELQRLFLNTPPGGAVSAAAFGELRIKQQRLLNINQVGLTLMSAYKAYDTYPSTSCNAQFKRGATLSKRCTTIANGVAAWTSWRMAKPALWFEVPTAEYRAKLEAVDALLHPRTWAAINENRDLNRHWKSVVNSIKAVATEAGYAWKDIAACKV